MDLVVGDDGKLILTKLVATVFHATLFWTVVFITVKKQEFQFDMWSLYATFAVGHAIVDKSVKQFQDFKNKQLDVDTAPSQTIEQTTVTKTVDKME